jgi:competence ComEA-like helix-hairpin-helix protein
MGSQGERTFDSMFTTAEKKYLALTLIFLSTGTGLKAYRHSKVLLGPRPDLVLMAKDSLEESAKLDSIPRFDSLAQESPSVAVDTGHVLPAGDAKGLGKADKVKDSSKVGLSMKVSLNRASPAEFMAIKGIGVKTAQLIVQYRKVHGPFGDLRDLLQVKGIGEKKLEKIIPFLIL